MIVITIKMYECKMCKSLHEYDASKEYETSCPYCGTEMELCSTYEGYADPEKGILNAHTKPERPVVFCPYCRSASTTKISGTTRLVSTGLFGLGSKKIGKQWHCNSCGSDF